MTIAELLAGPIGVPVIDLIATVEKAWPTRMANTQPPQPVQDIDLRDATGTIRCSWWDPTLPNVDVQTRMVRIAARMTKKQQLGGAVLRERPDAQGQPRREINVRGDHLTLVESSTTANARGTTPDGTLTEIAIYEFAERAAARFTEILTSNGTTPTPEALAALINTCVIALTQKRMTLATPTDQGEEPPPF